MTDEPVAAEPAKDSVKPKHSHRPSILHAATKLARDAGPTGTVDPDGGRWDYAFIENAAGKTTEKLFPVPKPGSGEGRPMTLREIVEAEG